MRQLEKRFPRYSRLLRLYPPKYRDEYGNQMLQTLADMLDDANTRSGRALIWIRTTFDLPISISKQQLSYQGEIMLNQTPRYMKFSSLAGAMLIAPFFVFAIANALTRQGLYDSLFWQTWVLFIWLIVLPALAIIINTAAFMKWSVMQQRTTKVGFWRSLFSFRRNWPALTVVIVALGIIALALGHDSVHCVGGNPLQEIANWHQTWQCIEQR